MGLLQLRIIHSFPLPGDCFRMVWFPPFRYEKKVAGHFWKISLFTLKGSIIENCSLYLSQNVNTKHLVLMAVGSHLESMRHYNLRTNLTSTMLREKQRNIARTLIKLCLNPIPGFRVMWANKILYCLIRLNWYSHMSTKSILGKHQFSSPFLFSPHPTNNQNCKISVGSVRVTSKYLPLLLSFTMKTVLFFILLKISSHIWELKGTRHLFYVIYLTENFKQITICILREKKEQKKMTKSDLKEGIYKMISSSGDYPCPNVLAVNIAPKSIDIQKTQEVVE